MTIFGRTWPVIVAVAILSVACSEGHASRPAATTAESTVAATTPVSTTVGTSSTLVRATGTNLLVASYSAGGHATFAVVDVDHGSEVTIPGPSGLDPYADNVQLVPTHPGVIVLASLDTGAGHAPAPVYGYRSLSTAPIVVGPATVALPSSQPGRAWLTSDLASGIGPTVVRLQERDLAGHQTDAVVLNAPSGSAIAEVAAVNSGFVATTVPANGGGGGEVDLYDRGGRMTGTIGQGSLLAAQAASVVWLSGGHIWIADLTTSHQRQLAVTIEPSGRAALSPDGTKLAVQEVPSGVATDVPLAIVDLDVGSVTTGPSAGYVEPVWDSSSRDLFFTEPDRHLAVWQVTENTVVRLGGQLPGDAVAIEAS